MKPLCSLLAGALAFLVFGVGTPTRAQAEFPGQWVGDLYSVEVFPGGFSANRHVFLIDENDEIHLKVPNLGYSTAFPIPKEQRRGANRIIWRDGAGYTLTYGDGNEIDEEGRRIRHFFYAKWEDGEWSLLGEFIAPWRELFYTSIPCDGGRLIVVSSKQDLTGNQGPGRTPFARFSIVEGGTEMRLDSAIDHGQEGLRPYMADLEVFKTVSQVQIVLTDRHATLINPDTGLYWVFSLEKATLTHASNIFKGVTPEMIAGDVFANLVLCVNPEKAGTVLISAQEEDFFLRERHNWVKEYFELVDRIDLTREDKNKLWRMVYQDAVGKSPFVAWYRLDPETGKVEKLREPPEGGTWLREDDESNDVWRPMPDGSVKMGWRRSAVTDKPEKSRGKTETENGGDAAPPEGDADGGTQEGEAVSDGGTNFDGDRDSAENTADKEKRTEVAG